MMHRTIFTVVVCFYTLVAMAQAPFRIEEPVRYLALGDSYTIGEQVSSDQRWPTQLVDSLIALNYEVDTLVYIARTGWRTDNLDNGINAVNPDSNFNLVSLLIGVNNQYQGEPIERYINEFPVLLQRAIDFAGGIKERVFVVSIPDYMYTPTRNYFSNPDAVSRKLDQYNAIAQAYCDSFEVSYFNITPISRKGLEDTELVASDGLHPSGKQYGEWVDLLLTNGVVTHLESTLAEKEYLFPNPVSTVLTVPEGIDSWKIFNLQGLLLMKGDSRIVDIQKINPGIGVFRGFKEGQLMMESKFVIKKQESY